VRPNTTQNLATNPSAVADTRSTQPRAQAKATNPYKGVTPPGEGGRFGSPSQGVGPPQSPEQPKSALRSFVERALIFGKLCLETVYQTGYALTIAPRELCRINARNFYWSVGLATVISAA
jgi:hypothetical protein